MSGLSSTATKRLLEPNLLMAGQVATKRTDGLFADRVSLTATTLKGANHMSVPYPDPVNGRGRCIEQMLSRHAESLDIARRLSAMGERFIGELKINATDPHQVLPTCLLIRQISGLRSLCLLAVNGFYTEALGHQRTLMEALARITALANNAELIHDYLAQDVLNTNKLIRDILSFRSDWGPDMPREPSDKDLKERITEGQQWLDGFLRKHGRKARDVKTFDWAQTGGVVQLLFGRFVISSEALHFSPRSLDHLMVTDGDEIKVIRIGPEDKDIDHLILSSCKYVFVGIQSLANSLSMNVPIEIDTLYQSFEAFYERKAEDALDQTSSG